MSDTQLDTLEAKGLIRLAAFDPELEYLFRHALVQDTAYESLLKQERRQLHRLVGDALEELYPDRQAELAAVLGMHFEQANDPGRAIPYLMAAARFANERNAVREAYELYSRAAKLLPAPSADEDDALKRQRVEIGLGRSKAGFLFLNRQEGLALAHEVIEPAEAVGDLRLLADLYSHVAFIRQTYGERTETHPELGQALDRLTQLARELNDPTIEALPLSVVGLQQVFTGEIREGLAKLEKVAPVMAQKRDFIGSSFALVAIAIGYARLGEFERGFAAARHASELAQNGDIIAKLDSLIGESFVRSIRGDFAAAIPLAMKCTELSEEAGATACVVSSNFLLGDAYERLGQLDSARSSYERSSAVADAIGMRSFRPSVNAYLHHLLVRAGNVASAGQDFAAALDEAEEINDRWGRANVIWKRGETEALKPGGDLDKALADLAEAVQEFREMEARPFVARASRSWGNTLRAAGRREEGEERLREALELFDALGIEREAEDVRETLAAG